MIVCPNLLLDCGPELIVELLQQVRIALLIDYLRYALGRHALRLPVRLVLPDHLLSLLENCLLVQLVVRLVLVARAHVL